MGTVTSPGGARAARPPRQTGLGSGRRRRQPADALSLPTTRVLRVLRLGSWERSWKVALSMWRVTPRPPHSLTEDGGWQLAGYGRRRRRDLRPGPCGPDPRPPGHECPRLSTGSSQPGWLRQPPGSLRGRWAAGQRSQARAPARHGACFYLFCRDARTSVYGRCWHALIYMFF